MKKKCLYCGILKIHNRDRAKSDFNTEHVVPQAFGKFGTETPTLDIVCKQCNQLFGDGIDNILARSGLNKQRFYNGLTSDFDPKKHFQNQSIKVMGGVLDGLQVIPSEQNPQVIVPVQNVDFVLRRVDGTYDWFTLSAMPSLEEFMQYPDHPKLVWLKVDKKEEIVQKFHEKYNFSLEFTQEITQEHPMLPSEVDVRYEFNVNEDMLRSIYKIGFNFFAHYCINNNLAYLPYDRCFDPIKRFILEGIKPSWFQYPSRNTMNTPILANEDPTNAPRIHIITFEANPDGCFTSSVAFYNEIHFRLMFACGDYPGVLEVRYARGFCPFTKKIIEIDTHGICV